MSNAAKKVWLESIIKGKQDEPVRVLIFGEEGIGKTSFAAGSPRAIFVCAEKGTSQLDVERIRPETWGDVLDVVKELSTGKHDFKTLVIDTLDWLEPLLWDSICKRDKQASIEAYGYGKGYVAALDEWRVFISHLERLQRERRMNIVLVAHQVIRTFKNPEGPDFDRYELNIHGKAAGLLKQWCDCVLFAHYETFGVADDKTKRTKGVDTGARIIHTQRRAAFDAKNRYGLPETLPLSWAEFEAAMKAHQPEDMDVVLTRIEENSLRLGGKFEAFFKNEFPKHKKKNDPAWLAELDNRLKANILKKAEAHNDNG